MTLRFSSLLFVVSSAVFLFACSAEEPAQCVTSAECGDLQRCVDGACEDYMPTDTGTGGDAGGDTGGGTDTGAGTDSGGGTPCVPADCNDDDVCTDDVCTDDGCEHTNNVAACDDGVFCNGADSCGDGSCSVHGGDPCGTLTCNEDAGTCDGECTDDTGCPRSVQGAWTSCAGFADTCDEDGTRTRDVASFSCVAGSCVGSTRSEMENCTRDTDGVPCDDGSMCTFRDRCTGGACSGIQEPCPRPCICDPRTGVCRDDGRICAEI